MKIRSALTSGAVSGIGSSLPSVSIANIFCLYYLAAGGLAAYLFVRLRPDPRASLGEGASVGALTGLFGGIAAIVTALIGAALGYYPALTGLGLPGMGLPDIDPLVEEMMVYGSVLYGFVVAATIGGLVGVAVFTRHDAAPRR